jgi:hypothetical protein
MSWNPPKIKENLKNVDIFVLTCIDPRFTYFLTWFLNHEKDVYLDYDLVALAGSSLCATNPTPPSGLPSTAPWLVTLDNHIAIAKALHSIKEVWIFDHEGCGAYVQYLNDDSDARHISNMNSMVTRLRAINPTFKYKTFLIKLDGTIKLISNDGGITLFSLNSYYPQRLPWILFFVVISLFGATYVVILMKKLGLMV